MDTSDDADGKSSALPADKLDAAAFVRQVVGRDDVVRARFLSPTDAKKNLVVVYRADGEKRVLKVYRQSFRYTLQAMKNPLSRHFSRAFTIRSLAPTRVRAELDGIEGFRLAGFRTFEVVSRPRRDALVFRHEPGEPLRDVLRRAQDVEAARRYVARMGGDLDRRQAIACERSDLRMIHPAPRLQHVWLLPDDSFLYYDFEDRVNPALRIDEAAAMETENFFFYLLRCKETADLETIRVARDAVGEAVMARWQAHDALRVHGVSGSARRRRWVLPAVLEEDRRRA